MAWIRPRIATFDSRFIYLEAGPKEQLRENGTAQWSHEIRKTAKIVKRSVSRAKVTSRAAGKKDARLRDWERCHDANGRVRVDSAPGGRKGV
ncbi:uncharacterized protein BO95DRAFT_461240 [Aspergillus brunneoviolaceus CBS 621.78]|uniref:Uncharacterized protein n=2 Tax=Aspergillus brunneoviolaceus CBS 621.78 TaxID=1450534 RepID=A0ACD1GG60_9EURO|nr:hypothetical protein BO95DRAFT_467140 [Aspergillus brunneoviolaceus CBS 621.78]XP_025444674.1 hypothetical protein BO95DRAFT_461240 [Aspergillus brunneoviolaceus CBS 621.78]RAH42106.1 hypothetical protein BO95DRAFT_467140 [Aspergillus brunneoviolaceus CBS 621.78]RAH48153.1 hypothetical protein BO95DRAFT_461240 [Aspergillus brunneoviolaceus CBS 621.78]